MNQVKPRLFVDMDGTLAVFRPVDRLETLYEKDYFLNLPPITNVVEAIRELIRGSPDLDIYIMSAHLSDSQYALAEKNAWLDEHLPEIPAQRRIFPPCGADKKAYIPGGQIRETDFLLDDYTRNLRLWQPPARGIKLLNGINHTNGSWNNVRIRYDKSPKKLAADILSVIRSQALIFDEKPQTERGNDNMENNNFYRNDKDGDGLPDKIDSTFNPPERYPEEKYGDYPDDDEMIKERLDSMTEADKDDFLERIDMVYADYADPTTFDDMLYSAITQERLTAQLETVKKSEISLETHDVFKISVDELAKLQEAAPCDFKSKVKEEKGEKYAIICCKKEDTAKIDSVLASQNKLRR